MEPKLADFLPTEKITLTPYAVMLLVDALTEYYPEMPDRELYHRTLRQLRQLAPFKEAAK